MSISIIVPEYFRLSRYRSEARFFPLIDTHGEITVSNFTIENIGALELNRASVLLSDDALEATAVSMTAPTSANNCGTVWPCARIDDGALEASVGPVTPTGGAWTQFCCRRIDDGALEAAAAVTSGPTIHYCNTLVGANCPRRIDQDVN